MKVTHPHLSHIQKEIPDDDVDRWVASGWIPEVDRIEDTDTQSYWDQANAEFKESQW